MQNVLYKLLTAAYRFINIEDKINTFPLFFSFTMSKRQSCSGRSTATGKRLRRLRASENDVERVEMQSAPRNSSERSGLEVSQVESPIQIMKIDQQSAAQRRRQATVRS